LLDLIAPNQNSPNQDKLSSKSLISLVLEVSNEHKATSSEKAKHSPPRRAVSNMIVDCQKKHSPSELDMTPNLDDKNIEAQNHPL
jgi:hypothetical protein